MYFIEQASVKKENVIKQREEKILKLMVDEKLKREATNIFKHMSRQPVSRRMSIVPGVKYTPDSKSLR